MSLAKNIAKVDNILFENNEKRVLNTIYLPGTDANEKEIISI